MKPLRQAESENENQRRHVQISLRLCKCTASVRIRSGTFMFTRVTVWLRKLSLSFSYLNTNSPSKRVQILKSEKEISELLEINGEINKSSLLEYYLSKPGQNSDIKNIYLAVFTFYNFKAQKKKIISQIRRCQFEFVFNVNARIQKYPSQLSILPYFSRVYIYCFYVFVFSFQKPISFFSHLKSALIILKQ